MSTINHKRSPAVQVQHAPTWSVDWRHNNKGKTYYKSPKKLKNSNNWIARKAHSIESNAITTTIKIIKAHSIRWRNKFTRRKIITKTTVVFFILVSKLLLLLLHSPRLNGCIAWLLAEVAWKRRTLSVQVRAARVRYCCCKYGRCPSGLNIVHLTLCVAVSEIMNRKMRGEL